MKPNLNYIEQLADGSKEFETKIISILKKEFPEEKSLFEEYLSNENYVQAAEMVHKMKHKLGLLSMNEAYTIAIRFEEELRENKKEKSTDFLTILDLVDNYISAL